MGLNWWVTEIQGVGAQFLGLMLMFAIYCKLMMCSSAVHTLIDVDKYWLCE